MDAAADVAGAAVTGPTASGLAGNGVLAAGDATATGLFTPAGSAAVADVPGGIAASSATAKIAASAAGADVKATVAALGQGKTLTQALDAGLQASLPGVSSQYTSGYVSDLAKGVVPDTVANSLGNVAGNAAAGATGATIAGKDIVAGAETAAGKSAQSELGKQVESNLPDVSLPSVDTSGFNFDTSALGTPDMSGFKDAWGKATDPLKKGLQSASDTVSATLKPAENAVNSALDSAGNALAPVGKALGKAGSAVSDSLSGVSLPNVSIPKPDLSGLSGIDLINAAGATPQTPADSGTAVSSSTPIGTAPTGGSAAALGAADVGIVTPDDVGSKVSKKGGKYPWGTPEGTTALKEGLGI